MTATTALTLPRRRRPHAAAAPGLLPVRPTDPPYDDELARGDGPGGPHHPLGRPRAGGPASGTTSTAPRELTSGVRRLADRGANRSRLPEHQPVPLPRHPEPAAHRAPPAPSAAAEQSPPGQPPDPRRTAAVVVRLIVEVLSGARPMAHLAPWTTAALQNDLARTAAALTSRQPGQVRSVRVSEPLPGIAEVSAVVSRGPRVRALALRMESRAGRWQVTTLQLG
ncbi:Rv3235 family protein [Frankia sp. EI5c]|uniref:Rv3235 family protein n=1 Tax=Frankia sp. EI5c TaxID=683316 RepID=UPI000824DCA2|nr:Rv3235 family protein [Frankia sp. EI5c]